MVKKGFAYLSLLLFAACGEVAGSPDAAGDDDEIDASAPPADAAIDAVTEGPITVTAMTRCCNDIPNAPESGVRIVAASPSGEIYDSAVTDTSGQATLTIMAGASVTAIYQNPTGDGANKLVSFLDVQPGDQLTVGDKFSVNTALGSMTVSWPAVAGATTYRVYHPCGSNSASAPTTTLTITENSGCLVAPMDILFTASEGSTLVRWGLLPDVTFAAGGSTTLNAWQPMNSFTLNASGLPTDVSEVSVAASPVFNNRTTMSASISGTPSGGMLSGTRPWAVGGDAIQITAFVGRATFGLIQVLDRIPSTETTATFDGTSLLPWLDTPTADGATRTVTWASEGTPGGDGLVVFLRWPTTPALFGGGSDHEWIVMAPPGANTLALPSLGAENAAFDVPSSGEISVNGGIIDFEQDDGYGDYRARPEWEATLEDTTVVANGRVAVTIFAFAN